MSFYTQSDQKTKTRVTFDQVIQAFGRVKIHFPIDINYVASRAGAGKSYAYIKIALGRSIDGKNTVIVVPTVALLLELHRSLQNQDPNHRVVPFHSEDGSEIAVSVRVLRYLREEYLAGDILLITHQCFLNLPSFPNKAKWKLLVDENIPIFISETLNLHENHSFITDHIDIVQPGPVHGKVKVLDRTAIKRMVDNENDDEVWRKLRPICSLLIQEDCCCYVKVKQLNDLKNSFKPKGQLTVYGFRGPDRFVGFDGVTIASAWFEDTFTFHHWRNLGVNWRVDDDVMKGLLRPWHPENPRLIIHYGYEGRNSKSLRNRLEREGNGELRQAAIRVMGDEPFLWLENNDRRETRASLQRGSQAGWSGPCRLDATL